MNVKICGIRSKSTALAAQDAGATHIGLNFIPTSRRFVSTAIAQEITEALRSSVKLVGVFQDMPIEVVNDAVNRYKLDYAQLHGSEDPTYCKLVNTSVIKAIRIAADDSEQAITSYMRSYDCELFLIDRATQGKGERIDAALAYSLARKFPLFLAGGLTPDNVLDVVRHVRPYGVDTAGGIETNGLPDINKIKQFSEITLTHL